jgi:hypothetical protein
MVVTVVVTLAALAVVCSVFFCSDLNLLSCHVEAVAL